MLDINNLVPYSDNANAPAGKQAIYMVLFPSDGSDAILQDRTYSLLGSLSIDDARAFVARCNVSNDWKDYGPSYGYRGDAVWLEGWAPRLEAGDIIGVHRNQGDRIAEVIATLGDEALVEYEMPNGTSALNILDASDVTGSGGYTTISYRRLPIAWLQARLSEEDGWPVGMPQQNGNRPVAPPSLILASRGA